MNNVKQLVACVIAGLASQSVLAADTYYSITTIGLTGVESNWASSINNSGAVVGDSSLGWTLDNNYLGYATWIYSGGTTKEIGLTDASHVNADTGYRDNHYLSLTNNSHVLGQAERFSGSIFNGWSAWAYNGSTTQEIGLIDTAHTNADTGYRYVSIWGSNAMGQAIGNNELYNGSVVNGWSAWMYDGSTTREIGLVDAAHTQSGTGTRYNFAYALNNSGQVAGDAYRYSGDTDIGTSAWIYSGSTTTEIGLANSAHTNSITGERYNNVIALNNSGQVAGHAARYNGDISTGNSAWVYNGNITKEIGLTNVEHTNSVTRERYNYIRVMNDAGHVAGEADRFNGDIGAGTSAWIYNGSNTKEIGLTDATHTNSASTERYNYIYRLNNAGQVAGHAVRYNGDVNNGNSAWFYNGNTTNEIGLTDAAHTNSTTGERSNSVSELNNTGHAIGQADRYSGETNVGTSAWFFNGSSTKEIGLTDAAHTNASTGESYNYADYINDLGQVVGSTERVSFGDPGVWWSSSAWYYDSLSDTTYSMDDFYASLIEDDKYSYINYLGEDGLALGSYSFSTADGYFSHAFSFSVTDGFYDLGAMVTDNVDWQVLYEAMTGNASGQIIGGGYLYDQTQMAFLLTPTAAVADPHPVTGNVVPVPASAWLMGSGLVALLGVGRKRQK